MSDLEVHPVVLTGGLQTAKARPDPGDLQRLENFTVFRGRFALRAPLFSVETGFLDDQGTPQPITHLLACAAHANKLYAVGYSSATQKAYLYECALDGTSPTRKGTFLWQGLSQPPRPVLASFEGGAEVSGTARLYIADYDEQQATVFWDGTAISVLQQDFSGDDIVENVRFHYVAAYQFHMWGAGFLQGTVGRKELLRFSQPGLIPAQDPDNPTDPAELREWHINDKLPIGRRGDKITALGFAGGGMIVYKYGQMFSLFGYNKESWAVRLLTERNGCVGPYAAASTGDGLCFAWGERGPTVTDGQVVDDSISEPVRKHVLEAEVSDKTCVAFSPDDGLVYFIHPRSGSSEPNHWLAFDKERKLWTEGEWLAQGGGILRVRHAVAVPPSPPPPAPGQPGALPGPAGAPSGLSLSVIDEDEIGLSWTNGDVALDTVTEISRGTSPNPTTVVATVGSGVSAYTDKGLPSKTTQYYRLRHKRNDQFSGYSNETSAATTLARPTGVAATRIGNGVRVSYTNSEAGANIVVERTTPPGSTGFSAITTIVTPGAGAKTYDDTTATIGTAYEYRLKATQGGQADSPYSNTSWSIAGLPASLTGASHEVTLESACVGGGGTPTRVVVRWTGTGLAFPYTVSIFRSVAGGSYALRVEGVGAWLGEYGDTWNVRSGSTPTSLQYRVDLLDNGVVVGQQFSTLSNQNVTECTGDEL